MPENGERLIAARSLIRHDEYLMLVNWRELLLLAQCSRHDAAFSQHQDACEILTPYATQFRYPGEVMEPDESDVAEAIQLATKMLDFVLSCLPADIAQSA